MSFAYGPSQQGTFGYGPSQQHYVQQSQLTSTLAHGPSQLVVHISTSQYGPSQQQTGTATHGYVSTAGYGPSQFVLHISTGGYGPSQVSNGMITFEFAFQAMFGELCLSEQVPILFVTEPRPLRPEW